ncbi:hypothetical protein TOPH_06613 [Tolypocladium ophioglossoides CBS 100239]|uniref:SMODS and SLOG-associating 2TM effector domain-containing protein n=1 Tax=Tolypocladium ophioglossoides (strain CBS 100239) TaxID=1163406 RepID=A0A0L0N415_TOLOC|nr:hypothetical protein TOPH_06613 [Tolypocladium ophioglossoides CBS 100239]
MPKSFQGGSIPMLPPIPLADSNDGTFDQEPAEIGRDGNQSNSPQDAYPAGAYQAHREHNVPRHRFLSPTEWATITNGIGGVSDSEGHKSAHPTSSWWPPAGMPTGLYRDIVSQRTKFYYMFHGISIIRWTLMVLQLLIGATLTSLGAMSMTDGTPITALGAANTVIAGFLALMHNSGLPDRYRHDMMQFEELEDHIKELLHCGIAPVDQTTDQVLAECFDTFREAKATVNANMPAAYNSRKSLQAGKKQVTTIVVPPLAQIVSKAPVKATVGGDEAPTASSTEGNDGVSVKK